MTTALSAATSRSLLVACTGLLFYYCGCSVGGVQSVVFASAARVAGQPPMAVCAYGCCMLRDDATARRLNLLWVANNSMTVDLCASIAYSEQWLVFGVEGGSECYGGTTPGRRNVHAVAPAVAMAAAAPWVASRRTYKDGTLRCVCLLPAQVKLLTVRRRWHPALAARPPAQATTPRGVVAPWPSTCMCCRTHLGWRQTALLGPVC